MNLDWKSPISVLKAAGIVFALAVVASVIVTGVAMAADIAAPGWGARLKSYSPFR